MTYPRGKARSSRDVHFGHRGPRRERARYSARVGPNLLTGDSQGFEAGVGNWVGTNATITSDGTLFLVGAAALKQDNTAIDGVVDILASGHTLPVIPGRNYEFVAHVASADTINRPVPIVIAWFTAADAFISVSTASGYTLPSSFNIWRRVNVSDIAPSTAAWASLRLTVQGMVATENAWWDDLYFREVG